MKVSEYSVLMDENRHPELSVEREFEFSGQKITTSKDAADLLNETLCLNRRAEEFVYELCFDTKMNLLGVFEVVHGGVGFSNISPREVFQRALLCGATRIIVAHNHPSGDVTPSLHDGNITRTIAQASILMGIPVEDHVIIGKDGAYFSYRENYPELLYMDQDAAMEQEPEL